MSTSETLNHRRLSVGVIRVIVRRIGPGDTVGAIFNIGRKNWVELVIMRLTKAAFRLARSQKQPKRLGRR